MNNIEVNNKELNELKNICIKIENLYKSLYKNYNEDTIRELLSLKNIEQELIEYITNNLNKDYVFSYITNIEDKNIRKRIYKHFELTMFSSYNSNNFFLYYINKVKEQEKLKRRFTNNELVSIECSLAYYFKDKYKMDTLNKFIYKISYTNPDIESNILENKLELTHCNDINTIDSIKNKIKSILLDYELNPNKEEYINLINSIELISYLIYLNDNYLTLEVQDKLNNTSLSKYINEKDNFLNHINKIRERK